MANRGRQGAVHLTIPVDLFTGEAAGRGGAIAWPEPPAHRAPADIARAIELLRAAERPVVIAGSGVWWSRAEEALRRFIERTSLPLYTITMARGAVSDDHPLVHGLCRPGAELRGPRRFPRSRPVSGDRQAHRLPAGDGRRAAVSAAARGSSRSIFTPEELGLNRRAGRGHLRRRARRARALWRSRRARAVAAGRPWLDRVRALRRDGKPGSREAPRTTAAPLHPAAFFRELRAALPRDVLYSWDGGDFAHWGRASLPARQSGGWLRLGPLGTIGSSLPNGAGAATGASRDVPWR